MADRRRFKEKIALITGGASGIGRASALRFASEGASIVIADINGQEAQLVAREIEALGGVCLVVQADVTSEPDNARAVSETIERFGRLDVVFANAGIGGGDRVADLALERWQAVIDTNLLGVFLTCKQSIPALIESGGGAIVNMASSMAGWDATEQGAAYMASKEAVVGLTRSLALQLGGHGIRVNAICPGVIQTPMGRAAGLTDAEIAARYRRFAQRIPLRRVGQPEDVAAAVAFLASDDARHITGSTLLIDGGQTLQSWSNAPEGEAYPLYMDSPE